MGGAAGDTWTFLWQNILLIGALTLVIFVFWVLLIRKRWKQNFLHVNEIKEEEKRKKQHSH
jgi:Na+(H+)/acetate symporter ActP